MDRTKKYERAKKYAKELGLKSVWYDSESFSAEDRSTHISVNANTRFDGKYIVEISWGSADIPRPTTREVKMFIKILQSALKLKEKLK